MLYTIDKLGIPNISRFSKYIMNGIYNRLTSSLEDCLEAVVMIKEKGCRVTVTALSGSLKVRKPSVVATLKKLVNDGLVVHERYGDVKLTPKGLLIAEEVSHRHRMLEKFLIDLLRINPMVAKEDACRMEHLLSPASLAKLEKFLEFVLDCPRGEPEWLKSFNYFYDHGKRDEEAMARCQRGNNPGSRNF